MLKYIKLKYLLWLILLMTIILSLKALHLNRNESFLNFIAQYIYFDENYYYSQYPEVKSNNKDAFTHYITHGWKDGNNPNSTFNGTVAG